jgi:hypothetical protein
MCSGVCRRKAKLFSLSRSLSFSFSYKQKHAISRKKPAQEQERKEKPGPHTEAKVWVANIIWNSLGAQHMTTSTLFTRWRHTRSLTLVLFCFVLICIFCFLPSVWSLWGKTLVERFSSKLVCQTIMSHVWGSSPFTGGVSSGEKSPLSPPPSHTVSTLIPTLLHSPLPTPFIQWPKLGLPVFLHWKLLTQQTLVWWQ